MASIFKRSKDKRDRTKPYYIAYTNEHGQRSVVAGCTDYQATEAIARKLESDAQLRKRGVIDSRADRFNDENRKPLSEHIADYLAHCEHVGQAGRHVTVKRAHLQGLVDGIGATRLSDLEPNAVERHLRGLKESGKAARTVNACRAAVVAFVNWAARNGRAAGNPLTIIPKLDERKDRKRIRRALTGDELSRLLSVAGPRRTVYLTAALTGLRRSELRKIVWADADFDSGTLRVRVEISKSAREDFIPLHPQAAEALSLARPRNVKPTDRVFATMPTIRTFYDDLRRAGIEKQDAEGRVVDLHSLRTTLATNLAKAGVAPQIAMQVMRHADMKTTLRHYTDLRMNDLTGAVQRLPEIAGCEREAVQATGTDGVEPSVGAQRLAQRSRCTVRQEFASECNMADAKAEPAGLSQVSEFSTGYIGVHRGAGKRATGLEPATFSLEG